MTPQPSPYSRRYYKGLGTSSAAEAKAYFSDLDLHELSFKWTGEADRDGIIRAFSKSMVEARKEWLRKYDPAIYVDHSASTLTYSDFVDKELIHFSNADNLRSIPSCVDGLKPGQRKILFACFKRGKGMLKNEVRARPAAPAPRPPPAGLPPCPRPCPCGPRLLHPLPHHAHTGLPHMQANGAQPARPPPHTHTPARPSCRSRLPS